MREVSRALRVDPGFGAAWAQRGFWEAEQGDTASAESDLARATKLNYTVPAVRFDLGLLLFKDKQFQAAAEQLEQFNATSPGNPKAVYLLAQCYLSLNQSPKIISLLAPLQNRVADNAPSWMQYALGLAYLRTHDFSKALPLLNEVAAERKNPDVDLQLAHLYSNAEQFAAARSLLRQAVALKPTDPKYMLQLGNFEVFRGHNSAALAQYQAVLRQEPDNFQANLGAGTILISFQRNEQALVCLRKAYAQQPSNTEVEKQMGLALFASKHLAAARKLLEACERARPDDVQVHLTLGRLYYALGLRELGNQQARLVRQLNIEHPPGSPPVPVPNKPSSGQGNVAQTE